jgi:hypothetical protein
MLSFNEEIEILLKSGLTPTELFITKLLLLAQEGDSSLFIQYINNISDGSNFLINILTNLQDKKVINKTFKIPEKGQSLDFDLIPFSKNFIKMYIKESNQAGKELFDTYPQFVNINGKFCSLRNFTKAGLYSLDEFCRYYNKQIKMDKTVHDHVIEMLKFGKDNNLINYSIIEFISSQKWLEIEHIKESGSINGYKNSELL